MNSEQLRLFINGAFGNEDDARKVRAALRPYLRQTFDEIRGLIDLLPDESLARQQEWRALLPMIEEKLLPYNDAFAIELSRQLPLSGAAAAEETTLMLKSVVPSTAGLVPPELIMAESTKFLLETKIGNQRVLGMFAPVEGKSPFTTSIRKSIDRIVTGGIIRGEETKVIAAKMIPQLNKQMASQSMALARTAIQDYNRQVKEEVWNANRDAFARLGLKYEWVSALDSRTCQTCAPLDGEVKDKKTDFPKTPVHVNCRCQVVLIDPEDPGRIRYGQVISDDPLSGEGTYKTKIRINGKDWNRQNREVKTVDGKSPRYADWLAQMARKRDKASIDTMREFFGGGNAGNIRANTFYNDIKKGKSPQQALIDLTNRVDKNKKVTSAKGVARRFKPADAPGKVESVTIDLRGDGTDHVVPMRDLSSVKYDVKKPLQNYETQIKDGMLTMQAQGEEVFGKLLDQSDKFTDSFQLTIKSMNTLDKASNAKTIADAKRSFVKGYDSLGEILKDGTAAAAEYRKSLLTTFPKKTMDKIVKNIEIVGGTKAQQATARQAIREFAQMFNGNGIGGIRKIKLDKLTDGGDFNISNGMIRIGLDGLKDKDLKNLLFHEMGHSLEYLIPGLKDNAVAWRNSRATAKKPGRFGFGKYTFYNYVKDKFYDEYVGRIYDWNSANDATEVISTGAEMFARPDTMLELLSRDPEHFFLINSLTRQRLQQ